MAVSTFLVHVVNKQHGHDGEPSPDRGPVSCHPPGQGSLYFHLTERGPEAERGQGRGPNPMASLWALGERQPRCQPRGPCLSPGRLGETGVRRGGKLWVRLASVLSSKCVPCTAHSLVSDFITSCRCGCLTASSGSQSLGFEWLSAGFLGGEKDDTNDSIFHFPDPTQGTFKMWKFY